MDAARRGQLVVRALRRLRRGAAPAARLLPPLRKLGRQLAPVVRRWPRSYSWTIVEHQVHPAYPVPYTIVLVELDDHPGVRFVGHLAGAPQLTDGQAMRVWFEQLDDGVVLPQWAPV